MTLKKTTNKQQKKEKEGGNRQEPQKQPENNEQNGSEYIPTNNYFKCKQTNGESSMEAHTLPYVKWIASGNLLCDSGNSNQGSVTTQRGGMEVQKGGDIGIRMADSC